MSAIFPGSDEQKRLALETKAAEEKRRGQKIATEILPLGTFYNAEDYHQKYYLRNDRGLGREIRAMFQSEAEFRDSTAAARANALVAGDGLETIRDEIDRLGLSESAKKAVKARLGR